MRNPVQVQEDGRHEEDDEIPTRGGKTAAPLNYDGKEGITVTSAPGKCSSIACLSCITRA